MNTPVIILGAGLSGLYAAWLLKRNGMEVRIVEARDRIGGRILGVPADDGKHSYDLGPSWIWPAMNPRASALVDALGLGLFQQYTDGGSLFEPPHGDVQRIAYTWATEPASMRVIGGMRTLVDALHAEIGECIDRGDAVVALEAQDAMATVRLASGRQLTAPTIISTLPPRVLVESVRLTPTPDASWLARRRETPTWMAGQAKLVATYATPFWREAGLSGTATSQRGPLVEIHDACDPEGGHPGLFGFVGYPAQARQQMGREALVSASIKQLARLFGPAAGQPLAIHLQDWTSETATATTADAIPAPNHPEYHPPELPLPWQDCLRLAGSECAPTQGGYIEGALEAAHRAVDDLTP